MEYILKTNNLTKTFKNTVALNRVNMHLKRGEIYGFVGENGAGKSTLIRVITGINKPTDGTFELNVSSRIGSVAAIVETPALYGDLNALNNLRTHRDLLALTASDGDLRDYLLLVGLESELYSKKKAKNFSLGMKQRLSIAFALMSNPEFIVLDEPMNGLDPVGIKNVRDLILKLNKENGTTFLISSHILNELDKVATTYGFISHGNLIEEISADDLLKKAKGYTKITLEESLTKESVALLEEFSYELVSSTVLKVADEKVAQKIFQTLINADVKVKEFNVERETIEDYYLKVISGGRK